MQLYAEHRRTKDGEGIRTLVHCRCEYKMEQLLGKTVWQFLK